jgi:hypothetical protein
VTVSPVDGAVTRHRGSRSGLGRCPCVDAAARAGSTRRSGPAEGDHRALGAISAAAEACSLTAGAAVGPRIVSPSAVTTRPIDCRRQSEKRKNRSAKIAPNSRPTEMTARTIDSGAGAPTCKPRRPARPASPPSTISERNRPIAVPRMAGENGRRRYRPRCLSRTAAVLASAQPTASITPAITRSFPCDRLSRWTRGLR